MTQLLRIGEVAKAADVSVQAMRFYERKGLVKTPARTAGGYRLYPPETVPLIRFIKRGQVLGFTLAEIEELLLLRDNPRRSCTRVQKVAEQKLKEIEDKLRDLRRLKDALSELTQSCSDEQGRLTCPILEALDRG